MPVLELHDPASGSSARIAPEIGFNCFAFTAHLAGHTVDVLDADPDFPSGSGRPSGHGIPLLFPYPNRVRGSRYSFEGRDYVIPAEAVQTDPNGNAIHGFCLDRPWRVIEQSASHAIGQFQLSVDAPELLNAWPTDFVIEVGYAVRGATLRSEIRVANRGTRRMPWGFGTHAYFKVPLGEGSAPKHCLISVPAKMQRELVDCLPTGKVIPVPEEKDLRQGEYFDVLKLDDVYTGVETVDDVLECSIMDEEAGLVMAQHCPGDFRDVVVYTPAGRNCICMEPYTCATDALNLEAEGHSAGLRVLEPGEEFTTWIEISVGRVIA